MKSLKQYIAESLDENWQSLAKQARELVNNGESNNSKKVKDLDSKVRKILWDKYATYKGKKFNDIVVDTQELSQVIKFNVMGAGWDTYSVGDDKDHTWAKTTSTDSPWDSEIKKGLGIK